MESSVSAGFPHAALSPSPHNLHRRQAAVVADLGLHALRNPRVQDLMDRAVQAVADTLQHEMCKVLELLPDRQALLLRSGVGWAPGLVGHGTVSAGIESQAGFTLMHGGPLVVPDLPSETRFNGPPLLHNHGVISGLSTPIYTSEGPWGVLGTHSKRRHEYTEEDVNFIVAVANVLGAAIERERYEQELRSAKARLEDLEKLRTQFLHSVSHELRTPLTPLLLQLEQLGARLPQVVAGPDGEGLARQVAAAERSGRRLKRLVDEFLDATRVETGRMEVHLAPTDLAAIVRTVVEDHRAFAEKRGIHLQADVATGLPVQGDAPRLEQALGNLLNNAIKFTPPEGRVRVEAVAVGDFAVVRVHDTGPGFAAPEKDQFFRPFAKQQIRSPRLDAGLGLGLFIVRGIVEQHGGRYGAESPGPGQGSTFWFSIRLAKGHRMTERVPAASRRLGP